MGCKAGGSGKLCEEMKTPRIKMSTYMESLRHKVGYVSLKVKYAEYQAKSFPSLTGQGHFDSSTKDVRDQNEEEYTPLLDAKN